MTASPTLERLDGGDVRAGEPQVQVVALDALGAPGVTLPREPYVTVLVPAHDEGDRIAATLEGLRRQTLRPTRVVVIADNCSDDTVAIARAAGAEVFETVGNTDRKAGALNQAWALRFRRVAEGDRRDDERRAAADRGSRPGGTTGRERRTRDRRAADDRRTTGERRGDPGGGLVGHLQRNEYARYARDVRRLQGKCLVVTGTAAMFRAATLRRISEARLDGRVPRGDGRGGLYDTTVLTEDNELTFAILHLGYQVLSPKECTLTTEVMPTWRALWNQRLRWKRGAIENCVQYGVTRITWRYWGRQLLTLAGVLITFLYLGSLAVSLIGSGSVAVQPFWLAVTGVFVLERVITVRDRGWRHMLAAATMYELLYDVFLQFVHARAYLDAALRRERRW